MLLKRSIQDFADAAQEKESAAAVQLKQMMCLKQMDRLNNKLRVNKTVRQKFSLLLHGMKM
jgi:hypothetical protein